MSDCFETLVVADVPAEEAAPMAMRIIDWLCARDVIQPQASACGLGLDSQAYPPGSRATAFCDLPTNWNAARDQQWRTLRVNGVEIETGGIVACSMECEFELGCPTCSALQPITGDELEEWHESASGSLTCDACGFVGALDKWDGRGQWGIGRLALTFWNWPPVSGTAKKELGDAFSHEIRAVYGKV